MIIQANTGKAELCFVKVPKDSNEAEIVTNQAVIPYGQSLVVPDGYYKCFPNHMFIDLPSGNWQILGNPYQLSEEQCNDIVDIVWNGHNEHVFKDYVNDNWEPNARSSFGGLLHALNIYRTNPFGTKRDLYKIPAAGSPSWLKSVKDWQDAEERKGSWILLKKV